MAKEKILEEVCEEIKKRLLNRLVPEQELSDEELQCRIDEELILADKQKILSLSNRIQIRRRIFDALRGFGVLQELLEDAEVTEILVNGPEHIFYEKGGQLYPYEKGFMNHQELEDFIQMMCAINNRMVNEASPIVDSRLPDGSRVNVVLQPVSIDGSAISIRKFSKTPMNMKKLLQYESVSEEVIAFLEKLVVSKYNILISGGTGSGKTTFLNALSAFIPKDERVVTIEDSAELMLNDIPNLVRLESRRPSFAGVVPIEIRDLIRTALRMRPSRIIVGECRGAEAADLLSANNTGHDGSIGTAHSNGARDMLVRLETMVLMGQNLPIEVIRRQIVSGIEIIIHLGRLRDGSRKLLEIVELSGMKEGEIQLHPIYQFEEMGEKNGKIKGCWRQTGTLNNQQKAKAAGYKEI